MYFAVSQTNNSSCVKEKVLSCCGDSPARFAALNHQSVSALSHTQVIKSGVDLERVRLGGSGFCQLILRPRLQLPLLMVQHCRPAEGCGHGLGEAKQLAGLELLGEVPLVGDQPPSRDLMPRSNPPRVQRSSWGIVDSKPRPFRGGWSIPAPINS